MANTPKYVRLRVDLRGRYDLYSGWGISGLDVKEMPDKDTQPNAYAFVKREIAAGRLEGASKAEFDEVRNSNPEGVADENPSVQERSVREDAMVKHSKIRQHRNEAAGLSADDVDEERRKAILKKQKAAAKGRSVAEDEDDEDDLDGTESTEGDDDDDDEGDRYDEMRKQALVDEANSRGVDASGTAEELRERLREADDQS